MSAAARWALLAVILGTGAGCVATGTGYGYGTGGAVLGDPGPFYADDFGVGYYERRGVDYGHWGPGYRVGPFGRGRGFASIPFAARGGGFGGHFGDGHFGDGHFGDGHR